MPFHRKMNLKPIILALAAFAPAAAIAQINSNQATGYAARAAAMLADGNFQGCIDQCNVALKISPADREQLMWLRALAACKKNDKDAPALIGTFIRQFPASVNLQSAKLLQASIIFFNGDYARALTLFRQISRQALQPAEADDLDYRMAYSLIKLGDLGQAQKILNGLTQSQTYGNAARFYLGYIAYVNEDYPLALSLFDQTDTSCPPGDMTPYYVGQIQFKNAEYSRAIATLQPLLARTDIPSEFRDEAERVYGEALYALGDKRKALSYLSPYIERHPDDAPLSARYIVGLEAYQNGNYALAIRLLAPVADLTDAMGQSAALTIGQAYMAQDNAPAALMQFEKATHLDFDPKLTEIAYYNFAVAKIDGGRTPFGSSVTTLENFIRQFPDSPYAATVQDYLVKGYISTDDYEAALRSLNSLKNNNSPQILNARQQVNFVLGTRALQASNPESAIRYLSEAEKFSARNPEIARQTALWLGDAYYAKSDFAAAQRQYELFLKSAPANDPNRPVAQYNLAYSLFAQKKYAQARSEFEYAAQSATLPRDAKVDCLNRIGDTYYYNKDFANALQTYQKAFDKLPETGDYSLLQIAAMQGHLGKSADKISTLDNLITKFPSSSLRPAAMTEKALAQASSGRPTDAIATYGEIVTAYPATAQGRNALLQLAILHRAQGNVTRAKEYYRLVISRHPSSSEAALAVQDLKVIYGGEGEIDQLNDFLTSIAGAPQLDAVERNAIAAAGLLRKARAAESSAARLDFALQLLEKYPDAEGAEEAMEIAAKAEYDQGLADRALMRYSELEERASSPSLRHSARMGILRAARDMGDFARILSVSQSILNSSAMAGADLPEVKFIRAQALANTDSPQQAMELWQELAKTPANIYGTRAAYEIADALLKEGKLAHAATEAEDLIDANPPHPYWLARTFILYSDILRAQGSDFEADEYLRVLRANYPGTEADIFQMIDTRLPKQ